MDYLRLIIIHNQHIGVHPATNVIDTHFNTAFRFIRFITDYIKLRIICVHHVVQTMVKYDILQWCCVQCKQNWTED